MRVKEMFLTTLFFVFILVGCWVFFEAPVCSITFWNPNYIPPPTYSPIDNSTHVIKLEEGDVFTINIYSPEKIVFNDVSPFVWVLHQFRVIQWVTWG